MARGATAAWRRGARGGGGGGGGGEGGGGGGSGGRSDEDSGNGGGDNASGNGGNGRGGGNNATVCEALRRRNVTTRGPDARGPDDHLLPVEFVVNGGAVSVSVGAGVDIWQAGREFVRINDLHEGSGCDPSASDCVVDTVVMKLEREVSEFWGGWWRAVGHGCDETGASGE